MIVPPNSFALARSVEYFRIPRDVLTICVGKSTYARCGIIVNVTPFEPEWEGFVTLEISNTTPLPAKIYANEGLCQILFFGATSRARPAMRIAKGSIRTSRGSFFRSFKDSLPANCLQIGPMLFTDQSRTGRVTLSRLHRSWS